MLGHLGVVLIVILCLLRSYGDENARAVRSGASERCTVELRSWVVAGRGRHMFAEIKPAQGVAWPSDLPLVVEYWSAAIREDYQEPAQETRAARIARMPLGMRVKPALVTPPDNRLEGMYRVTFRQAKELAKDRVFENRYFLLGPNSSSGLRAAFEAAGLELPERTLTGRGVLGEFPGVDLPAGREVPRARWGMYGLGGAKAPVRDRASDGSPSVGVRETTTSR